MPEQTPFGVPPRPAQDDPARAGEQTRFVLDQWGRRIGLDEKGNLIKPEDKPEDKPEPEKKPEPDPVIRRRRSE